MNYLLRDDCNLVKIASPVIDVSSLTSTQCKYVVEVVRVECVSAFVFLLIATRHGSDSLMRKVSDAEGHCLADTR